MTTNDITTPSDLITFLEREGAEQPGGVHSFTAPGSSLWRVASVNLSTLHGPATVTVAAHDFYTTVDGRRSASLQVGVQMPGLGDRTDWSLIEIDSRGPRFSNLASGAGLDGFGPVYRVPTAPADAALWDQVAALLNAIEFA